MHQDPSRPPRVASVLPHLIVKHLTEAEVSSHPYKHRNTDAAMKFQVAVANPGPSIPPGTTLLAVSFGTEYKYRDNGAVVPFAPVVVCNLPFQVVAATSAGLNITAATLLSPGQTLELHLITAAGQATVS